MSHEQRIAWIDMAKGYAMICVILAHIGIGKLGGWFYSWHMPVFFFLSGYTFRVTGQFGVFLKKQLKNAMIPYFLLATSIWGFNIVYCKQFDKNSILSGAFDFLIQRRNTTLWFLTCMILLRIMFWGIIHFIPYIRSRICIVLGLTAIGCIYYWLGGGALAWNIDVCLMAAPFFEFGYDYKRIEAAVDKKPLLYFSLLGITNVVCFVVGFVISGSRLDMYYCEYGNILITYISAFAGIVCVTIAAKALRIKIIQFVGRNSLFYMAWHQSIFIILAVDLLQKLNFARPQTEQMTKYFIFYDVLEFIFVFAGTSVVIFLIQLVRKYCSRSVVWLKKS